MPKSNYKHQLKVNFYKPSGKWYDEATAYTNHELYQGPGLIQDIIDTQDAVLNPESFIMVVENTSANGFHNAFFTVERITELLGQS